MNNVYDAATGRQLRTFAYAGEGWGLTTADFDYADNLIFSEHAVELAKAAIKEGVRFITFRLPQSAE